jgi:hypothetical protein
MTGLEIGIGIGIALWLAAMAWRIVAEGEPWK